MATNILDIRKHKTHNNQSVGASVDKHNINRTYHWETGPDVADSVVKVDSTGSVDIALED